MDRRSRIIDALLVLALSAPAPALAQTWSGSAGGNWSVGGNWLGGVAPVNGSGTAVVFPAVATLYTPFIDVPYTVSSLAFTGNGYTISGGPLTFDGASPSMTVVAPGNTMAALNTLLTSLTLTTNFAFTHSGGFFGPGSLSIAGPGAVTITGASLASGTIATTANAIVNLGDGLLGPGSLSSDVVNDGILTFDTPTITVNGNVSGSGAITVAASTILTKNSLAPFQHTGLTTVDGIVTSNAGPAISNNARLTINPGGVLSTAGGTVGSLVGGGSLSVSSGVFTTGGDNSLTTFSGPLGGPGDFVKTGTGELTLTGPSFVDGLGTVQAGGTLRIGASGSGPGTVRALLVDGALRFGAFTNVNGAVTGSGTITVDSGAFVTNNTIMPFTHAGSTTLNGTLQSTTVPAIINGAPLVLIFPGVLDTAGGTVGSLAGTGRLTLGSGTTFTAGADGSTTNFLGLFGGTGDFVKTGAGTLTVATNSWPGGTTTVQAPGTLQIGNGGVGPGLVGPLVANGTVIFAKTGSTTVVGPLTGTGSVSVAGPAQVDNGTAFPFTHAGPTTLDGILNSPAVAAIVNNAPLVINAPTGQLITRGGTVGSLAGSGILTLNNPAFTAGGDGTSTTFTGSFGGTGDFIKDGAGTLTVATNSWIGGTMTVNAPGTLRIGNGSFGPAAVGAIVDNGAVVFDSPVMGVQGPLTGIGTVAITSGSSINLSPSATFTHSGSTTVDGALVDPVGPAIVNSARLTINSPGFVSTLGGAVGSLAGTGNLSIITGTMTVGADNTSTVYGGTLTAAAPTNFVKVGTGTLSLTGLSFSFSAPIDVTGGTLGLNGVVASAVNVASGATLAGNGGTTGAVTINAGATIAPGNGGPGILPTGSLTLAGTYQAQIPGGGGAGVGYDQIGVAGTVSLNSPTLVLSGAYVPVPGPAITLILNDGADPVVGTFSGLPEGTVFTFNGQPVRITYAGGTGNDVELSLAQFVITSSAGPNGSITPLGALAPTFAGQQRVFTVTPNAGYAASVGGTCGGNLVGTTYTTNPVTADCTVVATFTQITFTVTPSAGPNGTIAPTAPQTIAQGATTSFTVTPATGYTATVGGTCGGSLAGNTFTTAAITANCTVVASFTLNTYTVTPSAGANGTITPATPQTINHGATTTFTVTPAAGYFASVTGTCGGNLVGNTFTTAAITASCTVVASFGQITFTVTPSVTGGNGTMSPSTPQTVIQGATTTFTLAPAAGYFPFVGGTCGGSLVGNTFTTSPITANCFVIATFDPIPTTSFTGPTATGTGNATASFTGGGATCTFTNPRFIPVTGDPASPPAGTAPAVFPHGLFTFTLSNCTQASTVTMTIVYPAALAPGTQYWKYGPEPGNATPHWYVMPSTITGATVVFSVTDGQRGDDDLSVNGTIVDQGGPGVPPGGGPIQTPTLSQWMLVLLASALLMIGIARTRKIR